MCGIIGAFSSGKDKDLTVNEEIANQFEEQHSRGTQGFGLITLTQTKKGLVTDVFRSTEPAKMFFDLFRQDITMGILHHRTPTSTPNQLKQTHPLLVESNSLKYDYLVVHNGIIQNKDEVRAIHEKDFGLRYKTVIREYDTDYQGKERVTEKFNDSESLAVDLAMLIEGRLEDMKKGVTQGLHCIGSAAFIVVQMEKKTAIAKAVFFGRNSNPLKCWRQPGYIMLSSEGEGSMVEAEKLFMLDLTKKGELTVDCVGDFTMRTYASYNGYASDASRGAWDAERHWLGTQSSTPNVPSRPGATPVTTSVDHTEKAAKRVGFPSLEEAKPKEHTVEFDFSKDKVHPTETTEAVEKDALKKIGVDIDDDYIRDLSKRQVMYESLSEADRDNIEGAEMDFQLSAEERLEKHRQDADRLVNEFFDRLTDFYQCPDVDIKSVMSPLALLFKDAISKTETLRESSRPDIEKCWNDALAVWANTASTKTNGSADSGAGEKTESLGRMD